MYQQSNIQDVYQQEDRELRMNDQISVLVERLNNRIIESLDIIPWASPVHSFGNLQTSIIATLGLNPSNREFVDISGNELRGANRRFHTLNSLQLKTWDEIKPYHLTEILNSCNEYFYRNPYDTWFKKLEYIISGTKFSYYFPSFGACHLDLIPYATGCKWTDLTNMQRLSLFEFAGDTLGILLKNSNVKLLILNGSSVVNNFQEIANVKFERIEMADWSLPRKSNNDIIGIGYKGFVNSIGGVKLNREIAVLGYNHNIQSSFGVTTQVQTAIKNWVTQVTNELILWD